MSEANVKFGRPIAFLTTTDPQASRRFYEQVLGLEFVADEPFALVFRVGDVTLRIQKVDQLNPAAGTVFGFEVDDIAGAADALQSKGVAFERYENMPQNERGIWQSPSGARVAWFKDPVGNLLSLTQA